MGSTRRSIGVKFLIVGMLMMVLGAICISSNAYAAGIAGTLISPKGICNAFPGGLMEKIVKCLTSTEAGKLGAIPTMVKMFLGNPVVIGLMAGINGAIFVLGATLLGLKLSFLQDAKVTKKELWIILFKISALMWFSANVYNLYEDSVGLINGLMDVIASAVSASICSVSGTGIFWKVMDCMFDKVTGVGSVVGLAGGLLGLFVASFFSGPAGWIIALTIIYFVVKMVFTFARVIHLYLMAFVGLGFTFCVSFLFVPLLFFQETKQYFDKWLRLTVGYILTPIFLFAYLGFAMMAIKEVVLCGPKSVFVAIGGSSADMCASGTNAGSPGAPVLGTQGNVVGANILTATSSSTPNEAPGGKLTATGNASTLASKNTAVAAGSSVIQVNAYKLDYNKVATSTGASSGSGWITRVLSALIAACLLMYILYELLEYIPEIATDLAHGGYKQGSIAGERALGETFALATVKLARDLPIAAAKGFVSGGKVGAITAVAESLNKYRQDVSRSDGKELR